MRATFLKAALGAAFAVSALTRANAAAPPGDPRVTMGTLPGGGRYVVRVESGAPVVAVALWYRAPSSGFDRIPTPGIGRLAAAAVAGSTPLTGRSLGRLVSELGGRIAVTSYPDSVAVSVLAPRERAGEVVRALTASFFTPVVDTAGFKLAQRDLAEESVVRQFSPEDRLSDAVLSALFSDGPAHTAPLSTPEDLRKITFERIKTYADRAFRPGNAVLVVTGAIDPAVIGAAVPGPASAVPGTELPLEGHTVSAPAPLAQTGPEPGIGLGWAGPAITSEREATAMDFLADYLFRADTGIVQREFVHSKTSVSGKFVTYHDPGVVLITISGGNVGAARTAVDAALASVRKPLDGATFDAALAAFRYHMLSDIQTPGELADTMGWYAVEGDASYAPGAGSPTSGYFAVLQSLTPDFVAATARKYLGRPGATVAVTEKNAPGAAGHAK